MKILYLLRSVQHPSIMRGALRHYHFLRELATRHEVSLVALSEEPVPPSVRQELEEVTSRLVVVRVEPSAGPGDGGGERGPLRRASRKLRVRRAAMRVRRAAEELARVDRPDVVLLHGKRVAPAIQGLGSLPCVVDFCDATSLRQRDRLRHARPWALPWRWVGYTSAMRTERRLVRHTRHLSFISARDRDAVLGPDPRARVIPNGIDLRYWDRNGAVSDPNRLVFTGVMDYAPNRDAALVLVREVMPILRRERPGLELVLAGRDPTPELVRAAASVPGVTVTGFVEDLRPYLETAGIYVAPIRFASGLQNKILEALAMRMPVVTTPVVADGLRLEEAADPPLRVASPEPGSFAQAVLSLLADPSGAHRLAVLGRQYVETHFDWIRGADALEELCTEAIAAHASVGREARGGR